jgi:hypothetical protein
MEQSKKSFETTEFKEPAPTLNGKTMLVTLEWSRPIQKTEKKAN